MRKAKNVGLIVAILVMSLVLVRVGTFGISQRTLPSNGSIMYTSAINSTVGFVVSLDGSGDFKDIQSAINAVPPFSRGIIQVKEGVYDLNPHYAYPYETIVVRSNLAIIGSGIDRTVIRSFPAKQPFGSQIRAMSVTSIGDIENVVIENLTVAQNGTPDNLGWSAIDLRGGSCQNMTIRNVKIADITGAAIGVRQFANFTVENCILERAYTGIALAGGSFALVKGNRITNMSGDGIFPQSLQSSGVSCTDLVIENNYIENVGDTGIDITSREPLGPHERITIQGNSLKNATIRVTYSRQIKILNNTIVGGNINVDKGVAAPIDVLVRGNKIRTSDNYGIGFYGAENSSAIGNEVIMTPGDITQSGIHAAIRGVGLIEGNTIIGARDYGISFNGWGLGGDAQLTLRLNVILDFGNVGVWDDNRSQGHVLVENNTIWDRQQSFISRYGLRTDYELNRWTIRYNIVFAGTISCISAPRSNVYGNIYEPPR